MKKRESPWIIGIGCGEQNYQFGNVTITVASCFEPRKSENDIKSRLERTIVSDFVPLTIPESQDKMTGEYMCSTAGEEENHAVEEKN